jgi:two-component system OmpR family sensor kinase
MKKEIQKSDTPRQGSSGPDPFFRELQIEFLLHELKDPFSVIEAGVRALLEQREKFGPLSPRQERTLQRILRSALKTKGMLHNLLEVGRSEAGCFDCRMFPLENAVLSTLLDSIEAMERLSYEEFRKQRLQDDVSEFLGSCGLMLRISPELRRLELEQDEAKFCQILGNLVKNALHHRKSLVEIDLDRRGDAIIIEVRDDGPGIQPEHREMIFARYAQVPGRGGPAAGRKGHGLGLAGARILARRLGGEIEVVVDRAKGAAFRFTLPVKPVRPSEASPTSGHAGEETISE